MKKIYLLLISLLSAFMTLLPASADETPFLDPDYCSTDIYPMYAPIAEIWFRFNCGITVQENVTINIMCGEEVAATGTLTAINHSASNITLGSATIIFDNICLPKGKSYSLTVPSGVISSEDNPALVNDELRTDFVVPENIGKANPNIKSGQTVSSLGSLCFYFKTEIKSVGNPEMTLYREGVPVRNVPIYATWDWGLGQAYAEFGEELKFEKGVLYSLVMPAGSVSALYRSDITNEEERVDFIGGYTKPLPKIDYVWCNLFAERDFSELNEVKFYYNQAIKLSADAKIQLFEETDHLIKEAEAFLTEENNQWVMTADFKGIRLNDDHSYMIVIPDGTVVTATGDVVLNSRSTLSVNGGGATGVYNTDNKDVSVTCMDGRLIVDNVIAGNRITVVSMDGKTISNDVATTTSVKMDLPCKGLFVVTVNGTVYKILNR